MRNLTALAIPLVLGFGLATADSEAAQAAPCSPSSGYLEGWDTSATCTASLWEYLGTAISVGHCAPAGGSSGTSYVWNNSGHQWRAWTGSGCSGSNAPLYAHTAGPRGGVFNNNIRSLSRDS